MRFLAFLLLLPVTGVAQAPPPSAPKVEAEPAKDVDSEPETAARPSQADVQRTQINLLGQTDSQRGESRRNENVQFNLVDNNALKELNIRLGTTATLVDEFKVEQSYFG